MAVDIPSTLRAFLADDSTLVSLLGGSKIYTTFFSPESAELPYITMSPVSENPAFLSKQDTGEEIIWDLHIWSLDIGSVTEIEAIKRRVRDLIRDQQPVATGGTTITFDEVGSTAQDTEGVYRRVISARLLVSA